MQNSRSGWSVGRSSKGEVLLIEKITGMNASQSHAQILHSTFCCKIAVLGLIIALPPNNGDIGDEHIVQRLSLLRRYR